MSNSNKNTPGQVLWPESLGDCLSPSSQQTALLLPVFQQLIEEEFLAEADLLPLFDSLYLPMSCWIAQMHTNKPLLLGINGAQGSGKSTLSKILKALLVKGFNKRVVTISIDDLYLCRSDRFQLAASVHPLLSTRGVPGTHDVLLAKTILSKLKSNANETISIPVFNKAKDDRADEIHWQTINEPVDIILFEGWCVGAIAQEESLLQEPVNILEADEDKNLQWRQFVNSQLSGPYQELFSLIDVLIMLKVPDMKNVYEWRLLQEKKLKESLDENPESENHIMSEQELNRFIMHYERITRFSLGEMPDRADIVMKLNDAHQVSSVFVKGGQNKNL